jgi:hypothetical protein
VDHDPVAYGQVEHLAGGNVAPLGSEAPLGQHVLGTDHCAGGRSAAADGESGAQSGPTVVVARGDYLKAAAAALTAVSLTALVPPNTSRYAPSPAWLARKAAVALLS